MAGTLLVNAQKSQKVPVDQIYSIPVAPGSKTYKPVAHGIVRDTLLTQIEQRGLKVVGEEWALSAQRKTRTPECRDPSIYTGYGSRCFGLLKLSGNGEFHDIPGMDTDFTIAIGIRNSHDKSIALGIVSGVSVFVCDNMALSGENTMYRRHTSHMEIEAEAARALLMALANVKPFAGFMSRMKQVELKNQIFESLICDMIRENLLTGGDARECLNAWFDGKTDVTRFPAFADRLQKGVYAERTAYNAHGIFTDLIGKEINPTGMGDTLIDWHRSMNGIFTKHLPQLN